VKRRLHHRYGHAHRRPRMAREEISRNHRGWTIKVTRSIDGVSYVPRIYKGRRLVETLPTVASKLGGLQAGARAIDREIGD
jgi:hypothetical protein